MRIIQLYKSIFNFISSCLFNLWSFVVDVVDLLNKFSLNIEDRHEVREKFVKARF